MKRRKFLPKKRKRKFNKFFSYKNMDRAKRSFRYKNFSRSNSYNTRFTMSDFSCANFEKARMTYCGFNGAVFDQTEFKQAILTGSRFKGARFKDTVFYATKLTKVDFSGATFENVVLVGTGIARAKGITKNTPGVSFFASAPVFSLSDQLRLAISQAQRNSYIQNAGVLYSSGGKPDYVSIKRLLGCFTEEELVKGLKLASEGIKKEFCTLSYVIAYMKKVLPSSDLVPQQPALGMPKQHGT